MVQFGLLVKLTLFLSSYVPLFIILSIELSSRQPIIWGDIELPLVSVGFDISLASIILLASSILLILVLMFIIWHHSGHRTEDWRCDHFKQRNELLSSYLLAYVFVFIGLNFSDLGDWLILILFLGMLAVLQMNSEMLHVNPILGLGGYRVYEVESKNQTLLVISRDDIRESIKIPESQRGVKEPEYRNIEIIQLGPNTYMTSHDQ
ncbi:hypothetical protein EA462_02455 [Natrarchaeobius halalkaliphilus]|uniref:Uncharacterized protein n=1 Tax=Natrarchaeobius halalkaliphilus TaxID=1679091 RepID=A0A3N6MGK4_9EURY|nr:hypothetical protein [Natrarchaeobius halalkaliphilus]RQG93086.1 hypothetical protein EA462_02455 [Natrarchaeobius halalkaliphilus]